MSGQTFSIKGQIVNSFSFMGLMFPVVTVWCVNCQRHVKEWAWPVKHVYHKFHFPTRQKYKHISYCCSWLLMLS